MVDRSWSELLSRRIPHDHVYSIIHNYVYEHFGTPSITFANRGSNATTRKYECSTCKKWSITLRCRQQVRKVVGVGDGKKSNNNKTWEVDSKEVKINCSLSNTLVSTESHLVQCTCKEDTIPTITRDLIANLPLFHTIIRTQPVQKTSLDDFRRRMAPLYPAMRFVKDTCLCKCRIAVLNSINNTELPDRYARLPAFLNEMSSLNEYLSTVLQAAEGSNEFFRYFHAFPIARHHGLLTQAISVIDCCHWKCNSYDGVMLFLVSKTGFGKTILLAVAILPVEDAASIAWFIQNCWRHGMTLEFPIFTDQGPMLAAARAIYKKFRVLFFWCCASSISYEELELISHHYSGRES